LVAFPDKSILTVSSALFSRWVCRNGLPWEIVSGKRKEFRNKIVVTLSKLMRIKKTNTTPYRPPQMLRQRSVIRPFQPFWKPRY
jgi:hypothetical protein